MMILQAVAFTKKSNKKKYYILYTAYEMCKCPIILKTRRLYLNVWRLFIIYLFYFLDESNNASWRQWYSHGKAVLHVWYLFKIETRSVTADAFAFGVQYYVLEVQMPACVGRSWRCWRTKLEILIVSQQLWSDASQQPSVPHTLSLISKRFIWIYK